MWFTNNGLEKIELNVRYVAPLQLAMFYYYQAMVSETV